MARRIEANGAVRLALAQRAEGEARTREASDGQAQRSRRLERLS
jgi:hypothetical protein